MKLQALAQLGQESWNGGSVVTRFSSQTINTIWAAPVRAFGRPQSFQFLIPPYLIANRTLMDFRHLGHHRRLLRTWDR